MTAAPAPSSHPQNCGTLDDCISDLITRSYSGAHLVTGTNTLTVNRSCPPRTAGSYGVVEVTGLDMIEEEWRCFTSRRENRGPALPK